MTERVRRFENGACVFDVADEGPIDGEIVVLLHGFPQTARSWDAVCPRLHERGYRTLRFDQRGYAPGARPRGRWAYRMTELVADVVALVKAAGGGPVHLVGHDWGGAVAWSMAAQQPALIRTLTAVSVPHPRALLRSMITSNQALRSYYMALFQVPGLIEHFFRRQPKRARWALRNSGMTREQARAVEAEIVDSGALTGGLNWYRALFLSRPVGKVSTPTTYVWSTGDIALGRRGAELTEKYTTGPYRFEILDGSHWIPEQQAERLSEIIVDRAAGVA
jgi:pimeloyl-ACP methyl ester carboxylesterase